MSNTGVWGWSKVLLLKQLGKELTLHLSEVCNLQPSNRRRVQNLLPSFLFCLSPCCLQIVLGVFHLSLNHFQHAEIHLYFKGGVTV